jgi:transcriptional regulator with XRE-family HTH domain/anti-sigma regulatory factor (Ser/Thr protein kinase)
VASSSVVSIAERLKQRREELGISQSQAARELDVARTAYRLWEMEAARPAPDRWRLIASWLGVSVTTMLLAEELVSEDEAEMAEVTALAFSRSGRDWDAAAAAKPGDFFEQARALIADGTESGDLTTEQAEAFAFLIQRIEQERTEMETNAWEEVELRRSYPVTDLAPRAAREALAAVLVDLPDEQIAVGRLLVSELVSNSVKYGSPEAGAKLGLFVGVERNRLRVEVSDASPESAKLRQAGENGGYGLFLVDSLSSRWGSNRDGDPNVTGFELDLPLPGI